MIIKEFVGFFEQKKAENEKQEKSIKRQAKQAAPVKRTIAKRQGSKK